MARYGLHLHLGTGTQIEKIALQAIPQSPFDRVYDELLEEELGEHEADAIWICKTGAWDRIKARIEHTGANVEVLGAPYQGRMPPLVTKWTGCFVSASTSRMPRVSA